MKSVNIQEAKTHLSRYAKRVKAGETIILCERNRPIAEIRPVENPGAKKRIRLGLYKNLFEVPEDFNAPLSGFEQVFYGENSEK